MRITNTTVLLLASAALVYAAAPQQEGNDGLPHSFQAGTPARASEVNENFAALLQRIQVLEIQVADLTEKNAFFTVETGDIEGMAGPHLLVEGANLHVRSGSGATADGGSPTGLGNLIVGYNELGGLSPADRTGSHNLVLGERNAYTSVAGSVAGSDNRVDAEFATVSGGRFNFATGIYASILGGGGDASNLANMASGEYAAMVGGFRNLATGDQAVVVGGSQNEATGFLSSVLGGVANVASGAGAAVSGGAGNSAAGSNAAISGGQGGVANGVASSISGGLNLTVNNNFDCGSCSDL